MFLPERQHLRVFAHLAPVDMRKQRHGLAALAQNVVAQDPCGGALFVFIGKGRDKLNRHSTWRSRQRESLLPGDHLPRKRN